MVNGGVDTCLVQDGAFRWVQMFSPVQNKQYRPRGYAGVYLWSGDVKVVSGRHSHS